jgi:hypothetical protein
MTKKTLIVCGNCERNGKKSILGEMDAGGFFTVMRFHQGYTKIYSQDMKVFCGACGDLVYQKVTQAFAGTASIQ